MEHVEYVYTFGMEPDEVERRLTEQGHGTLALADEGDAYAIPISYHYDAEDERILVRLAEHEGSDKMHYAETTTTATLVLYGSPESDESWSIVVRGGLTPADDLTDAEINELYQPIRVFGEDVAELEPTFWALHPDEITGRRTGDVGEE
ncbi:pyridoxamine 5'-phosphate oxidase family protein [Haloarchaeobius sp. HME9146]|uniref:pyridoxamine 5'-phosphate oxidase family protein n=1 Tax=Haloarchaeobius sp. HME9146 TaxID=2978732 RepID=UPI0021BFFD3C|nr:pyridoxamine 5'-phosphate oxidase family protein [Haloarchaeobius sp. HME9146]MCT9095558.1 pyridoxamine 5'-phosphate oxidase family protein [Haloarchaeobius sp. HME9146]